MTRSVILYPGEDGFVVAEVPSLPGCVSQGKTREEALANVREAISLHEDVLREGTESGLKRVNEPRSGGRM
jgi:predicted RNase H-like HicB family nuclease